MVGGVPVCVPPNKLGCRSFRAERVRPERHHHAFWPRALHAQSHRATRYKLRQKSRLARTASGTNHPALVLTNEIEENEREELALLESLGSGFPFEDVLIDMLYLQTA